MKTIYIAEDGKQFDDKYDCRDYEWLLHHPNLKYVRFYDKDGFELPDIMTADTYENVVKIIVPTDDTAKDLQELADYTGYSYYFHITESGVWRFEMHGADGKFVKAEVKR